MTSPLVETSSPAVVGHRLALLFEIGGEELLVVAAGDEADLLRVGLFGEGEAGSRAISRTSGLVESPSGKRVCASCSCVRPKRK